MSRMSGKTQNEPSGSIFWSLKSSQTDKSSNSTVDETDLETTERLSMIFKQLDRSGNGRINIRDLTSALKGFGTSHQYAEVSFCRMIFSLLPIKN